jgi:putative ABC transport system substrate-binding protein
MAIGFCADLVAALDNRIVILSSGRGKAYEDTIKGLQVTLREQDAALDHELLYMEGDADMVVNLLHDAEQEGAVKLVVTLGSKATAAALRANLQIPVVAGMVLKPENFKALNNATGVFLDFPVQTQFEWIREFLPHAGTIGVLYNPLENEGAIEKARSIAGEMGLKLVAKMVDTPEKLPGAMKSLGREADVLWGVSDSVVLTPQTAKSILLFSFRNRIPFIGLSNVWVKAGALYSLDRDYNDIGKQCGEIAVKILKGASADEVVPVPPRKIIYSLNRKTADHMKVEIPERLLQNAQEVF